MKNDTNCAHTVVVPGGGAAKGPDGKFIHEEVWKYLLRHSVGETGEAAPRDPACKVAAPKKWPVPPGDVAIVTPVHTSPARILTFARPINYDADAVPADEHIKPLRG